MSAGTVQSRERLVDLLARQAAYELEVNAWKGDWHEHSPVDLDMDMLYHAAKLSLAARAGDLEGVRELAADVANCAAMLADVMGALGRDPEVGTDQSYGGAGGHFGSADLKKHVDGLWHGLASFQPGPREGVEA